MKKLIVLSLVLIIGGMASCSKVASPEATAKAILTDSNKIVETATEKLNKATNGKEAGDALIEFTNGMVKIAERGKEFQKLHKDFDIKTNEQVKNENHEMLQKIAAFQKAVKSAAMKYVGSKDFMDAITKMQAIYQEANL
jgi:peptidoglycan hydrolase CwlO-like protein